MKSSLFKDPYGVLEISKNATDEEVRKAYKSKARQYHPDKNPGGEEKMKELNEAYTQITTGNDPMSDFPELSEIFKMFSNIGANFMNGGSGNPLEEIMGNMGKKYIQYILPLTLEELEKGGKHKIKYKHVVQTGKMMSMQQVTPFGVVEMIMPEEIEEYTEVAINVPKRHNEKENLIIGDLEVMISLKDHDDFKRIEGTLDLISSIDITLKEALCGFKRSINVLNSEPVEIECENIIDPYTEKRLEGLGMNKKKECGDLILKFNIKFPKSINENDKFIISKMKWDSKSEEIESESESESESEIKSEIKSESESESESEIEIEIENKIENKIEN